MTTASDRVARFVEAVKDDPRVLGVARIESPNRDGEACLLVACTWDGGATLPGELSRLGAILVGDGRSIERTETPGDARTSAVWTGVGVDGSRAEVRLRRAGDLVPGEDGRSAAALYDPRGVVATWIACCRAAPTDTPGRARSPEDDLLLADHIVRYLGDGRGSWSDGNRMILMSTLEHLRRDDPAQATLAARIETTIAALPGWAGGARVPGGDEPAERFERFLAVADAEGFKGDRVLFGEATKRLADLAKRAPVFDQGFVVPTFDAVEAGFALGEAVGGCQPPLIPGVYVGVGVTPKDALEFWAAPFVRDPTCSVACVDDTGERDVVLRAAGREPMIATLTSVVDAAFDRLPALIDCARDASKESVDPSAAMARLHLPKSFVERAKRRGADALMCSRLTVALAVARAGHDCAPLVARKFGLAAGRVIAGR